MTSIPAVSIETEFYNWQRHLPEDDPRYNRCSPNLTCLGDELGKRFGMTALGCYGERDIRAGSTPSSHSHGAATDRRYFEAGRARALSEILPWLIDNSRELHVQAIHDYFGSRIWRAGRTSNTADAYSAWWRTQKPDKNTGMGQSWAVYFHIETTRSGWSDSTPIAQRLGVVVPPPQPIPPAVDPSTGVKFMHKTIRKGDVGPDVYGAQVVLRHKAGQANVVCDGGFGAQTDAAVRNVQAWFNLHVDGVVGPETWKLLDRLANS